MTPATCTMTARICARIAATVGRTAATFGAIGNPNERLVTGGWWLQSPITNHQRRLTGRADLLAREHGLDGERRARCASRFDPAAQHLRDAPRLGDASSRRVRLDGVEDL